MNLLEVEKSEFVLNFVSNIYAKPKFNLFIVIVKISTLIKVQFIYKSKHEKRRDLEIYGYIIVSDFSSIYFQNKWKINVFGITDYYNSVAMF